MVRNRKEVRAKKKKEKSIVRQQGTGIRCPKCSGVMRVVRTDPHPNISMHGRFRTCTNKNCGHRVYTEERITIGDVTKFFEDKKQSRSRVVSPTKDQRGKRKLLS